MFIAEQKRDDEMVCDACCVLQTVWKNPRCEQKICRPVGQTPSQAAASTMATRNMAHSDSRLPATYEMWLKPLQRWDLKTIFTGSSAKRSQQTLTTRLDLPGPSGFLPDHLIQLTIRNQVVISQQLCSSLYPSVNHIQSKIR